MEDSNASGYQSSLLKENSGQYIPAIREVTLAEEEEIKAYISDLRTYFISGKKTSQSLSPDVLPIHWALKKEEDILYEEFSEQDVKSFGFSGKTAFQILNLQIKQQAALKSKFLSLLEKTISGINELLNHHGAASNLSTVKMDFAEDLISFDKIRDIAVSTVSSQLPQARLKRLKSAFQILTSAKERYADSAITIFASEEIMASFELEQVFENVTINIASENPCRQAGIQSQKNVQEFVKIIAALRMGNLMIEQKYDEDIHDPYFDQFDISFLAKEDLKYLNPTIVIENARQLVQASNDVLSLLSQNSFVKVFSINLLDGLFDVKHHDESDYLELASLAIFRRHSYVFQGSIDLPSYLRDAYQKGLNFPGSVFWNILLPSGKTDNDQAEYAALIAAIESRLFPRFEYEMSSNRFTGKQIKLLKNPAPNDNLLTYEQKVKLPSGIESLSLGFTVADFLAMNAKLRDQLEIIPPIYQSTNLLLLHEYLSQSRDTTAGKIPFIWLVDDENSLKQAAVPASWVQKCRSRLDYWNFLQSVSAINRAHLLAEKAEWEKEKNAEMEALKATLHEQYEKEKSGALQNSIVKMLNTLLKQGDSIEDILTEISKEEFQEKQASPALDDTPIEKEETVSILSEEAWVESDECTSCKDCVDALPEVFKYNDDKQAYVHNPKGGTFGQIVKLAEKCPARCIHPGIPQNASEPSLEKWVKRAEKYN